MRIWKHRWLRIRPGGAPGWILLSIALALLSLPRLDGAYVESRALATGEEVARALAHARASAMGHNRRVRFRIYTSGQYHIQTDADGVDIEHGTVPLDDHGVGLILHPPEARQITFNGMGWPVDNADGQPALSAIDIHSYSLRTANHAERRVTLSRAGKVVLCNPSPDSESEDGCPAGHPVEDATQLPVSI